MTRRGFLASAAAAAPAPESPWQQHVPGELRFSSAKPLTEGDGEMDVVFEGNGRTWKVPAFWAGGSNWAARFAAPEPGAYRWRSQCAADSSLHGREGSFQAIHYTGSNRLLKHGPLRITRDGRQFEHSDGTPFFFLGDDWWLGLTSRLHFPGEFKMLAEDRKRK